MTSGKTLLLISALALILATAGTFWHLSSSPQSPTPVADGEPLLMEEKPEIRESALFFEGQVDKIQWSWPTTGESGELTRDSDRKWNSWADSSRVTRFLNDLSTIQWSGQRQLGEAIPDMTIRLTVDGKSLEFHLARTLLYHNQRSTNISGLRLLRFLSEGSGFLKPVEDIKLCPKPVQRITKDSEHLFQVKQDWLREFCQLKVEHLFPEQMRMTKPVAYWQFHLASDHVEVRQHLEANVFTMRLNDQTTTFHSKELQDGLNQLMPE